MSPRRSTSNSGLHPTMVCPRNRSPAGRGPRKSCWRRGRFESIGVSAPMGPRATRPAAPTPAPRQPWRVLRRCAAPRPPGDPSQMLRGRRYLLCHLSIRHCAVELLGQSALNRDGSRQCDGVGGVERQGAHQHVMTAGAQGFRRGEGVVIGRIAAIRVQRGGGSRHHEMWARGRVSGRHVSLTVPGAGTRLGRVRRPGAGRARGRR